MRGDPSRRAARPGAGLPPALRRAGGHALRCDRLRRGLAAAQRRLAGRVRRPHDHPQVSREPEPAAPQRLSDSLLGAWRSEEHTSELQSLMRISNAVFCLKKKTKLNKLYS